MWRQIYLATSTLGSTIKKLPGLQESGEAGFFDIQFAPEIIYLRCQKGRV
jgi:hypothetical protein